MRLVVFGPQGAGKGTQSARLAARYGIPAIATGDIFRAAMRDDSPLGHKVRRFVDAGRLVPDDVTVEVVADRLHRSDCAGGWILDGFPRNVAQAQSLDDILSRDGTALRGALAIEVPEEVSLLRLTGRRTCSQCGRNYHVDAPPRSDWTCDVCGGRVEARADDVAEGVLRERLRTYHDQTAPLKDYYRAHGLLREIDGVGSADEVFERIMTRL